MSYFGSWECSKCNNRWIGSLGIGYEPPLITRDDDPRIEKKQKYIDSLCPKCGVKLNG